MSGSSSNNLEHVRLAIGYKLSTTGSGYRIPDDENPHYTAFVEGVPEDKRESTLAEAVGLVFGDGKEMSFFSKRGPQPLAGSNSDEAEAYEATGGVA